ncbi:MAG: (Fe-S)-binding protein [Chromatiaceae bacterium]|nr:(Fe-S)-binding protein [Chromatiaceae bacterium]
METFKQFAQMLPHLGENAQVTQRSDAERVGSAKEQFLRKLDNRMAIELESCIHCGHCASACHFYTGTEDPKYVPIRKLDLLKRVYRREVSPLRWLHRLYTDDITVKDLQEWQELVYDSCTECGRCSMVCPMGINIASMVNVMRQGMARADLMPRELMGMEQEQGEHESLFGVGPEQMQGAIAKLQATGIDIPLNKDRADILVTTSVIDLILFTDGLIATAKVMNHLGVNWTLRSDGYEAANFGLLSGCERVQRKSSARLIAAAKACGARTVIIPECGHAYPSMRWEAANDHKQRLAFEVLSISEFLGRELKSGRLRLNKLGRQRKVTFHDPCKIARHSGVIDEPRWVLDALGVDFREVDSGKELNWCCGGGAGVFLINSASDLRQKAFQIKMGQVAKTGADSVVTACGSCRLNFLNGKMRAGWDKEVESLVEMVAEALPGN